MTPPRLMLSCFYLLPRSDERQIAPLDLVSRARATSIQNVSGRALILKGFYSASTVKKCSFFTTAAAQSTYRLCSDENRA